MKESETYYKLTAEEICTSVNTTNQGLIQTKVENINFCVFPHVYPSHKFRTTSFMLQNLKSLVGGKKICDMGCGPGIVGLFSLHHGALEVIQADINQNAISNAQENNILHGFSSTQVQTYLSDCFDNIPKTIFDLIVFNMPFHCDQITINDPLKYAFYDPAFVSIQKFLYQSLEYSHTDTQVIIAFSNKGNTLLLESIFEQSQYNWKLWKVANTDQEYDNRLYLLTPKS